MSPAAILLNRDDNVIVCCRAVSAGERIRLDGVDVVAASDIPIGHKIARENLSIGAKVVKYGAPIGSVTAAARAGEWVHLHNMKSDYISAHTRAGGEG